MPPPIREESNRPKGSSLRPLRELIPFIRPHWRVLLLALFALLVGAGALLGLPVALRYVVDFGIAGKDPAQINRYFLYLLGVQARRPLAGLLAAAGVAWWLWPILMKLVREIPDGEERVPSSFRTPNRSVAA